MNSDDLKSLFTNFQEMMARQQAEHLTKPGWNALEDESPVWDKFDEIYKFSPSTCAQDWPSISEPKPSRTFDVSHIYGEDFNWLTLELSEFYSSCFINVIPKGQSIYVLDWHHTGYTFDPHAGFAFESMEEWPIPPFPNGDYYIFLTDDLSGGFFGHPWEQSICVIGEAFIGQLENAHLNLFTNLIRVDGVKV